MEKEGKIICDICSREIGDEDENLYRFKNERYTVYFDICRECREDLGH